MNKKISKEEILKLEIRKLELELELEKIKNKGKIIITGIQKDTRDIKYL